MAGLGAGAVQVEGVGGQLAWIAACIVAAAFAASAETALTALGKGRTRQLIEEGGHKSLELWEKHQERVISALLMLNTVANSLSAALTTALLARLGAPNAVAIATGAVTVVLIAFGEVTPKTIASRYAAEYAPVAMPVARVFYFLFFPAVYGLGWLSKRAEGLLFGPRATAEKPAMTGEEIEYMIGLGVREGVLDREKSQLLSSVLEFSDIVTREIMVPRPKVVALPVDAGREQVLAVVRDSEHSRIPVYAGSIDHVVGMLYARSILAAPATEGPFDLRAHLKPAFFVPELMKITRLLREFQKRKVHLAVVVDEFGGTSGVVALEDVVEEIVGEIHDEADVDEGRVRVMPDGAVVADAAVTLRDLEEHVKVDFPDELDADTLGGFVTELAGKVPLEGSVVTWERLRFIVRAGDERRVTRVEISRIEPPGAQAEPRPEGGHGPDERGGA